MRPPTVLCLLGSIGLSTASFISKTTASIEKGFTIPKGQDDGVYMVSINNTTGIATHTKVGEAGASPAQRRAFPPQALEARQPNWCADHEKACDCGWNDARDYHMKKEDCDAAVDDLKFQCRDKPWVKPRHHYYAVRGDMTVYYCNNAGNVAQQCDADELRSDLASITAKCGLYKPGWSTHDFYSYGYQEVDRWLWFCGVRHDGHGQN